MTLRTRIRNSTSSRSADLPSFSEREDFPLCCVDTSLGRGLARPTLTQLKALSRLLLYRFMRLDFFQGFAYPISLLSPSRVTPIARALIEEWQYRFGLALSLLSEGCSYSYSNLLDSFYLPVSIFGSRGSQVSIQM